MQNYAGDYGEYCDACQAAAEILWQIYSLGWEIGKIFVFYGRIIHEAGEAEASGRGAR